MHKRAVAVSAAAPSIGQWSICCIGHVNAPELSMAAAVPAARELAAGPVVTHGSKACWHTAAAACSSSSRSGGGSSIRGVSAAATPAASSQARYSSSCAGLRPPQAAGQVGSACDCGRVQQVGAVLPAGTGLKPQCRACAYPFQPGADALKPRVFDLTVRGLTMHLCTSKARGHSASGLVLYLIDGPNTVVSAQQACRRCCLQLHGNKCTCARALQQCLHAVCDQHIWG